MPNIENAFNDHSSPTWIQVKDKNHFRRISSENETEKGLLHPKSLRRQVFERLSKLCNSIFLCLTLYLSLFISHSQSASLFLRLFSSILTLSFCLFHPQSNYLSHLIHSYSRAFIIFLSLHISHSESLSLSFLLTLSSSYSLALILIHSTHFSLWTSFSLSFPLFNSHSISIKLSQNLYSLLTSSHSRLFSLYLFYSFLLSFFLYLSPLF